MPVTFLQRIADGSGVLAPPERAIALPPGWTIADHPNDALAGSPKGPGLVTGYSQLVSPNPAPSPYVGVTTPTTDGSTVTLATVPIPTGALVRVRFGIIGKLVAASQPWGIFCAAIGCYVNYSGTVALLQASSETAATDVGPPFGSGSVVLTISGSNVLIQVVGLTSTAWATSHAYVRGNFATNGGNLYVCTMAGTSASSGGPTGTGGSITDGGATWAYVSAGSALPTVSWCLTQLGVEVC